MVGRGGGLGIFRAGSRAAARRRLGLAGDGVVLLLAGRVQRLKGPDVLLRAAAHMIREDPRLASRLVVAFVGGPSGSGRAVPDWLSELGAALGISRRVRLEPPCPQPELADWYRAA